MITIEKKVLEKFITEFINTNDTRKLLQAFSSERLFYYCLLKDISNGRSSPNYEIFKKVARKSKVSESFIIDQAKSILIYLAPNDQKELDDYYNTLGITKSATEEEIRKKWLDLMKTHHPDKAGTNDLETVQKINEAYEVLGNSRKRIEYEGMGFPDIPVIVTDGASRKSSVYILPFLLITVIAFVYLSTSGLFFKSKDEKEEIASSVESLPPYRPDLHEIIIKTSEIEKPVKETQKQEELNTSKKVSEAENKEEPKMPQIISETQNQEELVSSTLKNDIAELDDAAQKSVSDQKTEETQTVSSKTVESEMSSEVQDSELDDSDLAVKEEPRQYLEENKTRELKVSDKDQKDELISSIEEIEKTETHNSALETASDQKNKDPAPDSNKIYIVKNRDSLWTISRKFDLTTEELIEFNNLPDNKLDIGDKLLIPKSKDKTFVGADLLNKGKEDVPISVQGVKTAASQQNEPRTQEKDTDKEIDEVANSEIQEFKQSEEVTSFKNELTKPTIALERSGLPEDGVPKPFVGPDLSSLYTLVSDYVLAYKNRDLARIKSFFAPGAKENGVAVTKVLGKYEKNFSNLDFKRYDIKVRKVELDGTLGLVAGDFNITFIDHGKGETKSSRGSISWILRWNNNGWEIKELNYKIDSVNHIDG